MKIYIIFAVSLLAAVIAISSCSNAVEAEKADSLRPLQRPLSGDTATTAIASKFEQIQTTNKQPIPDLGISDENIIEIRSINRKTSDDIGEYGKACQEWHPDSTQIVHMIRQLKPMSKEEWALYFYTLPCGIEGDLLLDSKPYKYSINSGGFIFLYDDVNEYLLGCSGKKCRPFFINIGEGFD